MTRSHLFGPTRKVGINLLRLLAASAFWVACSPQPARAASGVEEERASVRGHVFDARTGDPLQNVSVSIQGTDTATVTDEDGRFEIGGLVAGHHVLVLSAVSYTYVRRGIDVGPELLEALEIPMFGGAASYSETITVVAPLHTEAEAVPTVQVLSGSALQSLSGGAIEDPVRAAQALPGAVTGDDFRAEYSVRGSGPRAIGNSFEGVPTSLLLHGWHQSDGGSASMIHSDTVDGIVLSNGSYPQRYGDRTGAWMDITLREGSRERTQVRGSSSMTTASLVVSGPLGSAKRGSYLASARVNYIDKLLRALDTTASAFRFYDTQGKIVYDLGAVHQLQLSWLGGRMILDNEHERPEAGPSDDRRTVNDVGLLTAAVRSKFSPRWMLTQRVAGVVNDYRAAGFFGSDLLWGSRRELSYRADVTFARSATSHVDFGGQVHSIDAIRTDNDPIHQAQQSWPYDQYDGGSWRYGAHAMLRLGPWSSWTLNPGARFDRFTLTGQNTVSPWISIGWQPAPDWEVKAGTGIHHQYPELGQVLGPAGSPELRAERAWHADISVARQLSAHTSLTVAAYNRQERHGLRLHNSEWQTRGGQLLFLPAERQWFGNSLEGHSRGLELKLSSENPNGLSGWVSYALSRTKYRDVVQEEEFWGDYDQRHTVNLFGQYRWSPSASVSARFRYGSNYPLVGYFDARGDELFVGSSRNVQRVPVYSRLDIRANRSFGLAKGRLTLFAEVINVLDHMNVRQDSAGFSYNLRYVEEPFEEMFGRVPAVGILLEF